MTTPTSPSPKSFRAVEQGEREERRQGQHAGVHDQGCGGHAEEIT
jgi:hypothetical protein